MIHNLEEPGETVPSREKQDDSGRIALIAFGLRPMWRDVLLLCDVQGFSVSEASIILGLTTDLVLAHLHQARLQTSICRKDTSS